MSDSDQFQRLQNCHETLADKQKRAHYHEAYLPPGFCLWSADQKSDCHSLTKTQLRALCERIGLSTRQCATRQDYLDRLHFGDPGDSESEEDEPEKKKQKIAEKKKQTMTQKSDAMPPYCRQTRLTQQSSSSSSQPPPQRPPRPPPPPPLPPPKPKAWVSEDGRLSNLFPRFVPAWEAWEAKKARESAQQAQQAAAGTAGRQPRVVPAWEALEGRKARESAQQAQ